jgi:hypothetical protein
MEQVNQKCRPSAEFIVMKNLPTGITAQTLSDFLWEKLGLDLTPSAIQIDNAPAGPIACIGLTRETLAAFFQRYLEGTPLSGREIFVEARNGQRRARARVARAEEPTERWKRKAKQTANYEL